MIRSFKNSLRLLRIVWILARHDALFCLKVLNVPNPLIWPFSIVKKRSTSRPGERLRNALAAMGPSFIKFGQVLSTRADLIGDDIANDLASLRDSLPPFPTKIAKQIVAEELGASVDVIYASFDDTPIAAASIAQVHFATLQNGKEVAVKILRPGIKQAFARDLDLFFWLATLAEKLAPATRRLKPVTVVNTVKEWVLFELDLRMEASGAEKLKTNTKEDSGLHVPKIEWPLTSERVMTMERIKGIPIHDVDALRAANIDPAAVLEKLSAAFFNQSLRDGFFHADLHPGNIFVEADGTLAVVDFGIMGTLDRHTRIFLAQMFHGFLTEDFDKVAEVHFDAGYVPADKSREQFARACMAIAKPILQKPLHEVSVAKLLAQLFQITEEFEMQTQPQLMLLQKTMMTVEGIGHTLNPGVNMWKLSEPLITRWAEEHMGPLGRAKFAMLEARDFTKQIPTIIKNTEAALADYREFGLKLHPETIEKLQQESHSSLWHITFLWIAIITLTALWILY